MAGLTVRPPTLMKRATRAAEMLRTSKKVISSAEIAKALKIPQRNVWKLLSLLREAGCQVERIRAKGGGYRWVRGPRNLTKVLEKVVQPARREKAVRQRPKAKPEKPARKEKAVGQQIKVHERVLEMLERAGGEWVTGNAIAEELGVSRQRIHQLVARLRKMDYKIEGQQKWGYRLVGGRKGRAASRKGSKVCKKA